MANNKKMKTLGGYEIVDEKAREDINIVSEKADEALSLAKGATKAFVYDTYEDMISELNVLSVEELQVNYHIMIRSVCVPDLWVSGVSDEHVEYTYTSNEDFIVDLTEDGVVQVGHFVLSALETQKVDLSEYVKKTDYATPNTVGLVRASGYGVTVLSNGLLGCLRATESEIDVRNSAVGDYKPIVPRTLDYAVMKALSDCKLHEWTDEQKQLARALLNAIGKEDYAKSNKAGVVKTALNFGIDATADGKLFIASASKDQIDNREYPTSNPNLWGYHPIVLESLDYAVKKALSDCKLSGDDVWTDEEKASARDLLGVTDLVGSVESILTELHTYAESLVGGEV